jgi:hypothetical protein
MTIQQIYEKYSTPKNLQEHMLRVGALSKIITDNWTGKNINGQAIINACLLHDIAKPITFDITKQAGYGMPKEDIDKLKSVQEIVIQRYGNIEHKATVGMAKDIGMKNDALRLLENLEWEYIPRLLSNNDIESVLPIYCDMRIGPKGILLLNDRFNDLKARKVTYFNANSIKDGNMLEENVKDCVSLNLDSITDAQLNILFPELLKLEI